VIPGLDTRVAIDTSDPRAVVLRPADPVSSPAVIARLAGGHGEIRVRVPTTRVRLTTASGGCRDWKAPPLKDLDLCSCGPGDRMIIELHRQPPTEGGRLVSRIPGHGELFVGVSCNEDGRAHLFEVELHRWRDALNPQVTGPLQVRGAFHWIDLAYLRTTEPPGPRRPPAPPEPWWEQWVENLNQGVARGDSSAVELLVRRCLDRSTWPSQSVVAADRLPPAIARATLAILAARDAYTRAREALALLLDRADLPEAQILDLSLAVRSGIGPRGDGRWTPDDLEKLTAELPKGMGRDLLLAEAYYRYACATDGPAPACWDSCLDLSERFLGNRRVGTELLTSDAVLLREFARLMRYDFRSEADGPREDVLPSHAPWVQVARFANRYVREPRPRPRAYPDLPTLPARAPAVLRAEDAECLRALVDHARGASRDGSWTSQPQAPFAELLRARSSLYTGRLSDARDAYSQLLKRSLVDGATGLLELIAEERPLA
jgi:hypothetical protein